MDQQDPSLVAETAALKAAYEALNRNDVPGFARIFDPQIERVEPPGSPGSLTINGIDAAVEYWTLHRGKWAEGSCEPQRYLVMGDRIVVFAHVHVRLKGETEWLTGDVVDVFTFRGGKAIQYRTFVDSVEALAWAGAN